MKERITTYLLGAGASANSLPIVCKYTERFLQCLKFIKNHEIYNRKKNEIDRICTDFSWLIKNTNTTVDSLAHSFYQKKDFKNLEKVKRLLSFFLNVEQIRLPIDPRYFRFFEKIWSKNKSSLPSSQFRILNWNYDYQVELTLTKLADFSNLSTQQELVRQCLPYIYDFYEKPPYFQNFLIDRFSVCHLNGVSYCFKYDYTKDHFTGARAVPPALSLLLNPFEKKTKSLGEALDAQIFNYIGLLERNGHSTAIDFAWEKPKEDRPPKNIREKIVDKAIAVTKESEVLIVIGYSFPIDNLEIDKKLLSSMKSLNTIYIQDLNPNEIESRILEISSECKPEKKINIFKKDVNDFFIPGL